MSSNICQTACNNSFESTVHRLNEVLLDALVQANGDKTLEDQAMANFQRGLTLAKRVREICISACNT